MKKGLLIFIGFLAFSILVGKVLTADEGPTPSTLTLDDSFFQEEAPSEPSQEAPPQKPNETIPVSSPSVTQEPEIQKPQQAPVMQEATVSIPAEVPILQEAVAPAPSMPVANPEGNNGISSSSSVQEITPGISSAQEETKGSEKKKDKKSKKKKKNKKEDPGKDVSKDRAMEQAIRAQVTELRQEREKKMPYLDRFYIRSTITPQKIEQKNNFLAQAQKGLPDLVDRAKRVHTQARAANESIALSHRRLIYAVRKLFPEINYILESKQGQLGGEPWGGADWKISFRQPIFKGGTLWNAMLQEKASLEAAKREYDKVVSDLIFDVSRAFFEYQRTVNIVDEQQETLEKMRKYKELSEEKYEQKIISEIEHLNVQSLYSQMQFDLETANQEFELAKLDLQKYLDLSVNDKLDLDKSYTMPMVLEEVKEEEDEQPTFKASEPMPLFPTDGKPPQLVDLIDMSYGHRAELQVEAAKLQAARLGEKIRWGGFLPQADAVLEYGKLGEAYRQNIWDSGNNRWIWGIDDPVKHKEWRLMLELNWNALGNKVNYTFENDNKAPSITGYLQSTGTKTIKNSISAGVLDGLDTFVDVKQAEVDRLNKVVDLEKAEKQVLQDVKQAFYDYQKSVIQVKSNIKRVKWRQRLRDLSEYRLGRKEIEISEYVQSEADLVREKTELHKALKDYFTAKAALNHAIGMQEFFNTGALNGTR